MTQRLLLVHGFFWLSISFLPFPTFIVAEHLRSAPASAAAFYPPANLLTSLTFHGLVQAVTADPPRSAGALLHSGLKSLWGTMWCLICVALALLSPLVSLVAVGVLWVWWTVPAVRGAVQGALTGSSKALAHG